ncbi:hypothetical protein [Microbacterium sp. Leaf203]|uniref:hypothetical protein n=1 Tax=Microbacterium sp. Leaf203 TaxID=1735677 RepID=UPI0006F6638C|nr:hypothetical protein [Microbacterium sp. Leaf203]KQM38410.1 hypothetical protein ASE56_14100 [Microbacterium sp. Leaf203]
MTKTKPTVKPWVVGDAPVVDGIRWRIEQIDKKAFPQVVMRALSTTNHGIQWSTDIDTLNKIRREAA